MRETPGHLTVTNERDPLEKVHGIPIVGEETPGTHYLGRIIVELYEAPTLTDERGIAYSVEPSQQANIDLKTLAKRIADALPVRVNKDISGGAWG